jgi:hypothetical protein
MQLPYGAIYLQYGTHSSHQAQSASIWPPYVAFFLQMMPSSSQMLYLLPYGVCGSHTAHVAPLWCNPLNAAPMACTQLPHGALCIPKCTQCSDIGHVAPIWCIRLPCGAWEPHMAPFASQMVPSGSCTVQMAHIGPHMAHNAPMWCHPPPIPIHGSNMALRWHMRLPYSQFWPPYGPYTVQGAPIWHHPPSRWHTCHPYGVGGSTQGTWLLNTPSVYYLALHGFHMACMAPILCTRLLYSSHSSFNATWLPYGAVRLLYCATLLAFATGSNGYSMSCTKSRVTTHCFKFSKNITGIISAKTLSLSEALQLKF